MGDSVKFHAASGECFARNLRKKLRGFVRSLIHVNLACHSKCKLKVYIREAAMRILFVHPNYHSGGAEIAGNWPPAWVAYLAGSLKAAGFDDIALHRCDDERTCPHDAICGPSMRGADAGRGGRRPSITPSIYAAEEVLKIAQEVGAGRAARAGRHPCDLHVPAGAVRGALDRRDRARRGRGDPRRADAGGGRRALARRPPQDQGSGLPRRRRDRGDAGGAHGQGPRRDRPGLDASSTGTSTSTCRWA